MAVIWQWVHEREQREKEEIMKNLQMGPSSNFKLDNFWEKTLFCKSLNKLHTDIMLFWELSDFICCSIIGSTVTNEFSSGAQCLAAQGWSWQQRHLRNSLQASNLPTGPQVMLRPLKPVPKDLYGVLAKGLHSVSVKSLQLHNPCRKSHSSQMTSPPEVFQIRLLNFKVPAAQNGQFYTIHSSI